MCGLPTLYVYTASSSAYQIKNYSTLSCANLYAFCCERSFSIINPLGKFGMILPNSSISADKLDPLQKVFTKEKISWISNFAWRPSKLFDGANMLLAIVISTRNTDSNVFSSLYYKWYAEYRDFLFDNISYSSSFDIIRTGSIPKVPSHLYFSIYNKLKGKSSSRTLLNYFLNSAKPNFFFYFRAVLYWVKILTKEPVFKEDGTQTTTGEMKQINVENGELKYVLIAMLSSSLYFLHYIVWSSCQVINSRDFEFPFNYSNLNENHKSQLIKLGKKLQEDIVENSTVQTRNYSSRGRVFTMEKQYFYIRKSKKIIDKIDSVLSEHYGFTDEELDFIINYDIKYRMGKELDNGEEGE